MDLVPMQDYQINIDPFNQVILPTSKPRISGYKFRMLKASVINDRTFQRRVVILQSNNVESHLALVTHHQSGIKLVRFDHPNRINCVISSRSDATLPLTPTLHAFDYICCFLNTRRLMTYAFTQLISYLPHS